MASLAIAFMCFFALGAQSQPGDSHDSHERHRTDSHRLKSLFGRIMRGPNAAPAPATPVPARYPVFDLSGPINERPEIYNFLVPGTLTVREWTGAVQRAAEDPAVEGIFVRINSPQIGWARMQQLRRAILDFRKSGKPACAFLQTESSLGYLLASSCDRVAMPESSILFLTGLRADMYFLKDLLAKLGAQADVAAIGKYKDAMEALSESEMSAASREMFLSLIDDLTSQSVAMVAAGRGMEPPEARRAFEGGPYTAREAAELRLIDDVSYLEQLVAGIEEKAGRPIELDYEYASPAAAAAPPNLLTLFSELFQPERPLPTEGRPYIALVYATGPIVPGTAEDYPFAQNLIAQEDFLDLLSEVESDDAARAIVLRVESPGGSAEAADLIWNRLRILSEVMPVVASFGDVAASGGYYIGMPADAIVAEGGTLTGSIGVVTAKLAVGGLYEKIGVRTQHLGGGPYSGLLSEQAPWTEAERAKIMHLSEDMYRRFVSKAAEDRVVSYEALDRVAQGRVWTGSQAVECGLVDEIGGIERAIEIAAEKAGFPSGETPEVVIFPRQIGIFEYIEKMMSRGAAAGGFPVSGRAALGRAIKTPGRTSGFAASSSFPMTSSASSFSSTSAFQAASAPEEALSLLFFANSAPRPLRDAASLALYLQRASQPSILALAPCLPEIR